MTLLPTKPGWYWARWTSPAADTHEKDEVEFPFTDWCIVEVYENYLPPDDGDGEYLAVFVGGVRECQWLENFEWGHMISPPMTSQPSPPTNQVQG